MCSIYHGMSSNYSYDRYSLSAVLSRDCFIEEGSVSFAVGKEKIGLP